MRLKYGVFDVLTSRPSHYPGVWAFGPICVQLLVQLLLPTERSRNSDVQLTAAALEHDHLVVLIALNSVINVFNVFELQVCSAVGDTSVLCNRLIVVAVTTCVGCNRGRSNKRCVASPRTRSIACSSEKTC